MKILFLFGIYRIILFFVDVIICKLVFNVGLFILNMIYNFLMNFFVYIVLYFCIFLKETYLEVNERRLKILSYRENVLFNGCFILYFYKYYLRVFV